MTGSVRNIETEHSYSNSKEPHCHMKSVFYVQAQAQGMLHKFFLK